eukprot:2282138-Rhodomonas_salina.1
MCRTDIAYGAASDVYEGEWQDGLYHGTGKYTYASTVHRVARYAIIVPYHCASKYYASGEVYEGEWELDLKHGTGTSLATRCP